MGTPVKRRKLNDSSKASPTPVRNLDFFFGKQNNNAPSQLAADKDDHEDIPLTDEQLARKLQTQWDQEDAGIMMNSQASASNTVLAPEPDAALEQITGSVAAVENSKESIRTVTTNNANMDDTPMVLQGEASTQTAISLPVESKGRNTLSLQSGASIEDTITSNIPFDQSPLVFEPSKYVADLQNHWAAEGGNASYALLTRCFVLVNSTQSRIKIVDTLVNLLRVLIEGDPSSLLPTVRYIQYTHGYHNSHIISSMYYDSCYSINAIPAY